MTFNKRALLWGAGLFFLFIFSLNAQNIEQENANTVNGELSFSAGTLWVDDDGASWYWQNGLSLSLWQNLFTTEVNIFQVSSDLSLLNSSVFGGTWEVGVNLPNAPVGSFSLGVGFFKHSFVEANIENMSLSNEEGQGIFVNLKMPIHIGHFSIIPSFLQGNANWGAGNMYYFYGRPNIPYVRSLGIELLLNYHEQYKHGLGFRLLSANIEIVSNYNESLFNALPKGFLFYYKFSMERKKFDFTGTLGGLYARAELDGTLTSTNQPYFLFPFNFYNLNTSIEAQAGFALANFQYNHSIFRYGFDLGLFHIFDTSGSIDIHYRYKSLFGGTEESDELHPNIKGLGAAILILNASVPEIPLANRFHLSLGLQKAFVIPWGYESTTDNISASNTSNFSFLRSALLSGLSLRCSIKF